MMGYGECFVLEAGANYWVVLQFEDVANPVVPIHPVDTPMAAESEPLESYYDSKTLAGLLRSGWTLLGARRVQPKDGRGRQRGAKLSNRLLYILLIVLPAIVLEIYQRLRTLLTKKPRHHPQGAWQFYLETGLREDMAHHTNETTGFQASRLPDATELDELTAWVMAVIQFLWHYDDLMATIWDEAVLLRLVNEAARQSGLENDERFQRLMRQWEVQRPYGAPLNGTYADVRRAAFVDFISSRLEALPADLLDDVLAEHATLAATERQNYQRQMSLLATLDPARYQDHKTGIPLWNVRIGLIVNGHYYLIDVVDHNQAGKPIIYSPNGEQITLRFNEDGTPFDPTGERLELKNDQFRRVSDNQVVGYLDMAPASRIKWQLREILQGVPDYEIPVDAEAVDMLLVESVRTEQKQLVALLHKTTQASLHALRNVPIIINWDERPAELSTLANLRRAQRGVGSHALTIMRTASSFLFDMHHVFFDGTWAMAIAEVLTNTASMWRTRCMSIYPSRTFPLKPLSMLPTPAFLESARSKRQIPEISAETTIYDISSIMTLRRMLAKTGTLLTVNDLLVTTRIFHAAHYNPSPKVSEKIKDLSKAASSPAERHAIAAINRSLERGRLINPALLIPVDASPTDPAERIFPITFRNLADNLVWIWDDTWEAYQAYRRIEPPDTPEGIAAFQQFALKRTLLVGNLRAFSYILDANKQVALRGDSIEVAILNLLVGLPSWLQHQLKQIVENSTVLNEIVRGDEVYSNVGRVVQGSSIRRFMTAKDDGNTKALAWGIMSDDDGRLYITMRDFRPHVRPLVKAGHIDLARDMAQDYVNTYTSDLIGLVARLSAMLQAEPPV